MKSINTDVTADFLLCITCEHITVMSYLHLPYVYFTTDTTIWSLWADTDTDSVISISETCKSLSSLQAASLETLQQLQLQRMKTNHFAVNHLVHRQETRRDDQMITVRKNLAIYCHADITLSLHNTSFQRR